MEDKIKRHGQTKSLKDQKFVTKTQNMEMDQNINEKINGIIKT